ncbi:MAG TPA: PAS domain-containing protein [Chitinophagaceae bacterium]|nr:PAS domain-containing protein [Chitinophagaceae bacterium]
MDLEVERLSRQLSLLNDTQVQSLSGSWEWEAGADHFFWTDSMFSLYGLPATPDNMVPIAETDQYIHKHDLPEVRHQRQLLQETGYTDFYFRIITPAGHPRRLHICGRQTASNKNIFQGICQDEAAEREITQPLKDTIDKQAHQLRVFERAEEVGQTGSWQINLETFETVYSDNVYQIYGLAPQTITPHVDSFRKYIHPEDRAVVLKAQEKAYVEMIPLHLEYRIVREDGEVRYINQVSHLVKNSRGEHILSGSIRDTTEQRLLENQLREANEILNLHYELFRQAEQIGRLATWQVNLDTRKAVFSDNVYRIYGLKPQSVTPVLDSFLQYIHPEDREMVTEMDERTFAEHTPYEVEFRIIRTDGRLRILRQKSKLVTGTDGAKLMIGVLHDITEQKEKDEQIRIASEKLVVQNESFRLAEKVAGIGSWTWNLHTNEVHYSDNIYIIYGLKPQSIPPGFDSFGKYMHPEDKARMSAMPEKIRESLEPLSIDYRIFRADGELRYLRSRNQPITSPEGHTIIIGTTQDVTEEVLLHQELMERIGFAQMLEDTIVDRIIVTDTSNNIVSWNRSCEDAFKIRKEDAIGRNFFDVMPQAATPQVTDRFKRALAGETIHVPMLPSSQVQGISHELFMVPFKDEKGKVTGILHVLHDITHQQQLQEQLSGRLQFIEKLLEASVDRIMVLDADLHFQLWNKECEKYYGYTKEQIIGKNILEIFPKFKTDPLYHHCLGALEGETVHVPANERGGLPGYQESYFIPLRNEVKEITGVLWIIHDLTERYLAEERLRTSETHLRAAQEIALIGSFEIDIPEKHITWSEQAYKIFEYPAGETIDPRRIYAAVYFEDRALVNEVMRTLQEDPQELYDLHFRLETGNQVKNIHCRGQVVLNEDGKAEKVIGTVQDVTSKREAQYFVNQVTNTIPDIVYVLYIVEKRIIYLNKRTSDLLGIEPEYVMARGAEIFKELQHPDDHEKRMEHITQLSGITEGELREIDVRMKAADGQWRWFKLRDRLFKRRRDGSVWQTIGTAQDITDRRLAEEKILQQQELLQQTEGMARAGSWELDLHSGSMNWSNEMFRMYGYPPQSFEPDIQFFLRTISPAERDQVRELIKAAKKDQEPHSMVCSLVAMDGELRYAQVRCKGIIPPGDSAVTRIVGSVQDITEHKHLEDELKKKQAAMRFHYQLDRQVEKIRNVATWQWDVQSGRIIWGENMFRMFGLPPHSFEPTIDSFISLIHEEDGKRIADIVDKIKEANAGPLPDYEFKMIVRGEVAYFRASGRVVAPAGGKYVVGSVIDITKDALLHQRLYQLNSFLQDKNRQLEEMNEELTAFAFVASHDLREPLRKIQIFSDWLREKEAERLSSEGVDRFRRIQAAVKRMDVLIDDILSFSRINTAEKKFERVNPDQILENVKNDLGEMIRASNATIHADPLPEIKGHASQVAQLFQNLLSNAIKYQAPGNVPHIVITAADVNGCDIDHPAAANDAKYTKISFADNGIGFEEQYTRKIFQMFQRLHGIHEYPGTGMGLAICKKIAEHHGGFIIAKSQLGNGAIFECYFPQNIDTSA